MTFLKAVLLATASAERLLANEAPVDIPTNSSIQIYQNLEKVQKEVEDLDSTRSYITDHKNLETT